MRDQHIAELESLARQPDINEILSRSLGAYKNVILFELCLAYCLNLDLLLTCFCLFETKIYCLMNYSVAPNIFEFEEVKKGVLCQLFGGTNKQFNESGRGRFRFEFGFNDVMLSLY